MTRSTPASTSRATRSSVSGAVPTAAPTRSRPCSSLQARGKSRAFWMSLTVIMPRSRPSPSTTSTFSMRWRCSSCRTSSRGVFSRTVTSFSRGVMTFETGRSSCSSKRMSRWVMMPTTWLPSAVTGRPEMPLARVSATTSRIVASGRTVIGSLMTPLSCFLTRPTSRAWSAAVMFLWTMPMPPSWAIVIARRASVTVSIAAETNGRLRRMPRVSRVERSTSRGSTSEYAGTSRTSSKVSASWTMRMAGIPGAVRMKRRILRCLWPPCL